MNKYLIILAVCVLVLQIELFGLLMLEKQNLHLWESQKNLNDSMIHAIMAFPYQDYGSH